MAHSLPHLLDDLEHDQLRRFRFYLTQKTLEGFPPIRKGHLENSNVTDIVEKMIEAYSDEGALEITLHILRQIHRNDLVLELEREREKSEWRAGLAGHQSSCAACKQGLRDPVSFNCGHRFCRQCIRSDRDQPGPSGEPACPQCGKRSGTYYVMYPHTAISGPMQKRHHPSDLTSTSNTDEMNAVFQSILVNHKTCLKKRFECIFEGISGNETLLNSVFTELYITEGESEGVNNEHEVWQIETASRTQTSPDTPINCNDIFKPLPGQERHIRTVLTKGIAGIGKTVSVQKFILDWAVGKANQDIDLIFVLPFRELNLITDLYSLHGLINGFHPELREMDKAKKYAACRTLFIFDGLDESRLPLDFHRNKTLFEVTEASLVEVLLTNLIKGNLFPSALLWITSRPAAANQIPRMFVNQVTEVRGFNDPQKEEYFIKRFSDGCLASRIISHIKTSTSLYIMCHIPVFCWISAKVLERMMGKKEVGKIPKTLTEMYTHFLLIQTNLKNLKYHGRNETDPQKHLESDKEVILKLGQLAFDHLQKCNLMFYEEDLKKCGIDVSEASVYSGLCTEIFKEESVFYQKKVYCFVHLSIQEFFAAVYVFHCYTSKNMDALKPVIKNEPTNPSGELPLHEFLEGTVDRALESKNGHLDLFLRFLLGISLESNQKLLQGLLTQQNICPESSTKVKQYLKRMQTFDVSPERCINLFHCLTEMNDRSLYEEVQIYLRSDNRAETELSPAHCSALAYVILMSEDVLDEFDLKRYNTTFEGRWRLVPAVRCCRKALLASCYLTKTSCETVATALHTVTSHLKELDLGNNHLKDAGLNHCQFNDTPCEVLASALMSNYSCMRELDLSNNDLQDAGVKLLSAGLGDPHCKLETLSLSFCLVAEEGCASLASALTANPSHLRDLDLSYNHPGDSGVQLLSARLEDPHCKLEKLNLDFCGKCRIKPGLEKYACELTLDLNTVSRHLYLSEDNTRVEWVLEEQPYPNHLERYVDCPQVLCREGLTGRGYWQVEWMSGEVDVGMTKIPGEKVMKLV